jgi:cytochrome P450
MIRSMLEKKQSRQASASLSEDDVEDDVIKDVSAMAYIAGSDTTVSAIMSFFLAMLIYPEVQQKAQAEIDRVVGRDRLPEMEDMIALPYVSAVVTETLRWLPVLPMGTIESFQFTKGYANI